MGAGDQPLLCVRGLTVSRPDGSALLRDVALELRPGEVAVLLGGSGAGKSTLMNAVHDPARLRAAGFGVESKEVSIATPIGIVPQRGALFDHLSVAGNIKLAMRNASAPRTADPQAVAGALEGVDLPTDWARDGHPVDHVSGGEAQRVAVARTLAGGRKILFFDEPSVGLDPHRVNLLADLLRQEIREAGAAALVITHDLGFAAGLCDQFLYVDRDSGGLVALDVGQAGDEPRRPLEHRRLIEDSLEDAMIRRLAGERNGPAGLESRSWRRALVEPLRRLLDTFEVVPRVVASIPHALARPRDFIEVFRVVFKQAVLRPAPFFAIVSVLIGFTLLYIFHRSFAGGTLPVRPDRVFGLIGSMHVIALAPALTGILFSATSANAITAWLGGMSLTRQTAALRALGLAESRYLWLPAWLGLAGAFVLMVSIFVGGMVLGGVLYLDFNAPEVTSAYAMITADLFDPTPEREVFRTRAIWLAAVYAVGIGADAVAKGASDKNSAESVTVSMVRSVMAVTLGIVALELCSLVWVYA
jgi:taurine transport system ATP-binding protein